MMNERDLPKLIRHYILINTHCTKAKHILDFNHIYKAPCHYGMQHITTGHSIRMAIISCNGLAKSVLRKRVNGNISKGTTGSTFGQIARVNYQCVLDGLSHRSELGRHYQHIGRVRAHLPVFSMTEIHLQTKSINRNKRISTDIQE